MAEDDSRHVQAMERAILQSETMEARIGQFLAFLIALAALGCAAYALYLGYPTAAAVIGGATLGSLVTAFLAGRFAPPK